MKSIEATVDISKALAIGGWMSERELLWLAIHSHYKNSIVEFGSLHGRSSRAMADNMPSDGKLWCIDPWAGDYFDEEGSDIKINTYVYPYFCMNLQDHILVGKVIPVRGFSYCFSLSRKVDMVFIDGDHRYETVVKDIKKAYELLDCGGTISGHDYDHPMWPGVKKAVDELVGPVKVEGTIWHAIKS